jgi:ABC-type molybdate transport system permease subunit
VQSINYSLANRYALLLLAFSFVILLLVYVVNHHFNHAKTLP